MSGRVHFRTHQDNDSDEIIKSISDQAAKNDDQWELTPAPDSRQLEKFWTGVLRDSKKDDSWIQFAQD